MVRSSLESKEQADYLLTSHSGSSSGTDSFSRDSDEFLGDSRHHNTSSRSRSVAARLVRLHDSASRNAFLPPLRTTIVALVSALLGYLVCSIANRPDAGYVFFGREYLSSTTTLADLPHASFLPDAWTPSTKPLVKPEGLKVVGLIFYGRPMFVNILDCYLRKNLAVNGGYLDEVHFIANTKHEEDLEFLARLVEEVPQYIRVNQTGEWTKLWEHTKDIEADAVIVKIDDDIVRSLPPQHCPSPCYTPRIPLSIPQLTIHPSQVYMADDAIPRLVHTLLTHPNIPMHHITSHRTAPSIQAPTISQFPVRTILLTSASF